MSDHDYRHGGWKDKYIIFKSNGKPCDPNAVYFVLRLDEDPNARVAALAYADSVEGVNPKFAADIREKVTECEVAQPTPGVCRVCGCTDRKACPGGCSWADESRTICSQCVNRE